MTVVGVDIGGTKVAAVAVDPSTGRATGPPHWREHGLGPGADPAAVAGVLVAGIRAAAATDDLEAVGLSVAGWLDAGRTTVRIAANLGLVDVALPAVLAARLGCPVMLDNDGNLAALAEVLADGGAAEEPGDAGGTVVVFTLGTGVGGGIVRAGRLLIGDHGLAGELGHLPVPGTGRDCVCGGIDCLEVYAGGLALARAAGTPDARTALAAARRGDAAATAALARAADALAAATGALVPVVDPSLVVLGGSVAAAAGPALVEAVATGLDRHRPLARVLGHPHVRLSRHGPTAAALGAALHAATLHAATVHAPAPHPPVRGTSHV